MSRLSGVCKGEVLQSLVTIIRNGDNDIVFTSFHLVLIVACIVLGNTKFRCHNLNNTGIPRWVNTLRSLNGTVLIILIRGQEFIIRTQNEDRRTTLITSIRVNLNVVTNVISGERITLSLFISQLKADLVFTGWQVIKDIPTSFISGSTLQLVAVTIVEHNSDTF